MYLTLNSEFRPFTYDELVKPLSDYTEAYNKVEEQYSTLAQQTEAWKNIATQENSPEAYAMYKRYSDELNAVIDDFSRGMTAQNRSKLTGLKSRYSSEITPISLAYDAMSKANAYRDTVKGQDNSAIFNVDRYNSLDDFLNGQIADNNFISGNALQAQVANLVDSQITNDYGYLRSKGLSHDRAFDAARGKDVTAEVETIKQGIGYNNFDDISKAKIDSYINKGYNQGVGSFTSREYTSKLPILDSSSSPHFSDILKEKEAHQKLIELAKKQEESSLGSWYGNKGLVESRDMLDGYYPNIIINTGDTVSDKSNSSEKSTYSPSDKESGTSSNSQSETNRTTASKKYEQSSMTSQGKTSLATLMANYEDEMKKVIKAYAINNGLSIDFATSEFENNADFYSQKVSYVEYTTLDGDKHLYVQLPSREDLSRPNIVNNMINEGNSSNE